MEEIFSEIYFRWEWGRGSGEGSRLENTGTYRTLVERFMEERQVSSVVDFGCGDWQFSRSIDWSRVRYLGLDCVEFLVEENRKVFGQHHIGFEHFDFHAREDVPEGDLAIVKDVFQHWTNQQVLTFLPRLSGFRFVLITNCRTDENADIEGTGHFRPLDVSLAPFEVPVSWAVDWYTKRTQLWEPSPSKPNREEAKLRPPAE